VHRVEARHRVLEDHRDLATADLAEPARARGQQVLALPERLPRRHRRAARVEAHDREARDALAGAGLADDPERLALVDRERDAVDRAHDTIVRPEVRLQVDNFEEGHVTRA